MQIVNNKTVRTMLKNGFNGNEIIRLGSLAGRNYCSLSEDDKLFLTELKKKLIYVFTCDKPKSSDIVNGYHIKFEYASAFISSHLLVLSGDHLDNTHFFYDDNGKEKRLKKHL